MTGCLLGFYQLHAVFHELHEVMHADAVGDAEAVQSTYGRRDLASFQLADVGSGASILLRGLILRQTRTIPDAQHGDGYGFGDVVGVDGESAVRRGTIKARHDEAKGLMASAALVLTVFKLNQCAPGALQDRSFIHHLASEVDTAV
jgi:hypothetical protein